MASPFQGKWCLYGTFNSRTMATAFHLPPALARALLSLRPTEEVHVNGDRVHIRIEVPEYEVPSLTMESNATFGQECTMPIFTTGLAASGILTKESDTKWVAALKDLETSDEITLTNEILNGELWATYEARGMKMIQKYERVCKKAGLHVTDAQCCSPFSGSWSLYGTEGCDQFLKVSGVSAPVRRVFSNLRIHQTIHVNRDRVHIRFCVDTITVPKQVQEVYFTFGETYDYEYLFTGSEAKATVNKVIDSEWHSEISGLDAGDLSVKREIVNGEMWVTFNTIKGKVVRKFEKCDDYALCY